MYPTLDAACGDLTSHQSVGWPSPSRLAGNSDQRRPSLLKSVSRPWHPCPTLQKANYRQVGEGLQMRSTVKRTRARIGAARPKGRHRKDKEILDRAEARDEVGALGKSWLAPEIGLERSFRRRP
jgi:hypothetical protein